MTACISEIVTYFLLNIFLVDIFDFRKIALYDDMKVKYVYKQIKFTPTYL